MLTLLEMRQERHKLNLQARDVLKPSETEKRDMTPDENEKFDALMKKVDELAEQIETKAAEEAEGGGDDDDKVTPAERLAAAEEAEKEDAERSKQRRSAPRMQPGGGRNGDPKDFRSAEKYEVAFRDYLRHGIQHGREYRDLALGTTGAGGYLVTPTKLSEQIIVALNNLVFMRGLADIETLTEAASLGVPTITTDISDADWTAEVPEDELTGDSSLATGRRDLSPEFLCKAILVSHKLLKFSSRVENVIDQRMTYKFGVAEEKAFMTGDGSGKPLGVFTADANGIPTTRDVTAASTTVFTADELIDTAYNIPQQYSKSTSFGWIMHRNTIAKIRKFKNGEGSPLWQPALALDRPETFLGFPIYQSEYAPNTYTAGNYVAILGDFKFYKIADVANMEIQRLNERFALKNQVGFLGRRYVDGMPILANAFSRLKLAAA